MTAHKRALFKSALTIGLLVIAGTAIHEWPILLGYAALLFIAVTLMMFVYGAWRLYEDEKDFINRRR